MHSARSIYSDTRPRDACRPWFKLYRKAPSGRPVHERNFIYFLVLQDGSGNDYPMFFHLRKRGGDAHLALFVESAYPKPKAILKQQIADSAKVSFPVLCAKVFQNQALRFNVRR